MLQGSFASGRYTSTVLFVLSMLVMLAAYWLPTSSAGIAQPGIPVLLCGFVPRIVSLVIYVFAAVLLSRQTFFDRRMKWMGALYLWLVAVSTFVNGNPIIAFSSLLFLASIILLLLCQYSANPVGILFTSFMLLGILILVTPFSLYLIPLYLAFGFFANVFSARGISASLLGLVTPFWLVVGTAYVFSCTETFIEPLWEELTDVCNVEFPGFSILLLLLLALILVVLLPASITFFGGTSPSKPLLRRRFSYIIVVNIYLLLLFCTVSSGAGFFYMCQLPCTAILASYLFAKKESKLSNVYFVIVNAIIVAIATQSLCLML
ncbi:MAG: hypothetical protein IKY19_04525 [Bacteroidaceae bacterium]|nr:hypothetical protein [Bacteroidaceae bacterium]